MSGEQSSDPLIRHWAFLVSSSCLVLGVAPLPAYDALFGRLTPETPYYEYIVALYGAWGLFLLFVVWPCAMAAKPEVNTDVR